MSDFSTSDWPQWKSLTSTFKTSFPAIEEEVYSVAGEIWPRALNFARGQGLDDSDAREALLKAVAAISRIEKERIKSLPHYLFTAYAHLVGKALNERNRYASLDSINSELLSDPDVAARMEKNVLLAEIVARMDNELLRIYQGLILGYSFEELARMLHEKPNVLRSRFSRGVRRIATEINKQK